MDSTEKSGRKGIVNINSNSSFSSKVVDTSQIPPLMRQHSGKRILNQRPSNAHTKKLRMRSLLWVKPHATEEQLTSSIITQVIPVLIVNLAMISVGMSLGFSAIALPQLKEVSKTPEIQEIQSESTETFHHIMSFVDEEEGSWIAGIYGIGAVFGGLAAAVLGTNVGRRKALLFLTVPDIIGWILIVLSQNLPMMLVGRFFCGLASAGYLPTVQVFVAEIAQPSKRGWLNAISIPTIAIGTLITYVLGAFTSWTIVAGSAIIFPLLLIPLTITLIPDSPYFYLQNGNEKKALRVMERFRSTDSNALAELLAISQSLGTSSKMSVKECLENLMQRQHRKPFLILNFLFLIVAFSGKYSIGFYAVDIFHKASEHTNEYYSTIVIGVIRVLGAVLHPFAIRRYSRKSLLIMSSLTMAMSLSVLGLTMYSHSHHMLNMSFEWIPVTCITIYIISDSLGLGSIPYLYLGEFYPTEMRSLLSGITIGLSNLEMFLLVKSFPNMNHSFGDHGTFWIYAGVCFLAIVYTMLFIPETKGKSLEEIEEVFNYKEDLHVTPYVSPHQTPMSSKRRNFDQSIQFTQ